MYRLRPGGKSGTFRPWDCDADCRAKDGRWDDAKRAARGCTRVDLPPVAWDVDVKKIVRIGAYTGRESMPGVHEIGGYRCNPRYPPEDPTEGCPGGWRLNRFTMSLAPYFRIRTAAGGRVPNPILDRCDDPLVHQLVNLYEREQERCAAHTARLIHKD